MQWWASYIVKIASRLYQQSYEPISEEHSFFAELEIYKKDVSNSRKRQSSEKTFFLFFTQ